jgi:Protein of unknown function (DUF3110)
MFLICLQDHPEGVYSVISEDGEHVILFFEEEEDAERYLGLLIDNDTDTNLPELEINETDIDIASKICENKGYCYTIVTPNDFIIPPTNT